MRAVSRRNTRQGGLINVEQLVILVLYGIYLALALPLANRLQPVCSPVWLAIVLAPLAVRLLVLGLHDAWCWVREKQRYTMLNAAAQVLRLEVLVGLFGAGMTMRQWLA